MEKKQCLEIYHQFPLLYPFNFPIQKKQNSWSSSKTKEIPRSKSNPADQCLRKERRHGNSSLVFPHCFLKYPTAMDDDFGACWAANSIFFFTVCNSESAERSHCPTYRFPFAVVLRGQCCKTDGSFSTSHFFLYIYLEILAVNTEGILRHLATGERL